MKAYPALRRWLSLGGAVAVFAIVLAILAGQGSAGDDAKSKGKADADHSWPMFGGHPSRNFVNLVEKNLPVKWSVRKGKEENLKWSVDLGTKAYGGPVIAGGKIFVGTNNELPRDPAIEGDKGVLMCFRESDGKFLWQAVHDKLPAGRVNDWPEEGICSSPVVEGNRLWYVNNRCEVICADPEGDPATKKEKVVWKLDLIKDLNVFPHNLATCSPLIAGDTLFLVTSNGVDEGHINIPQPEAPSFLALDKKTGKVLWKDNSPSAALVEARKGGNKEVDIRKLVDQAKLLMHGQWASPVYAEPNGKPMIIFPGGDGWMRGFNPANGELLWKFDCNPKGTHYELGPTATRNDFVATPIVWENKLYIGVGQDPEHDKGVGHLWCIDLTKTPKNPDKDLTPAKNNFDPKAPENKDSGLVWHFGGDSPPGAPRPFVFGRSLSTCAVHDGLLYTADLSGIFYCIDALTGKLLWDFDMKGETWTSPYWVDGKVYVGSDKGKLYVFEHGREKKQLGMVDMRGKIRATPVAVNGVLYVMTENPCRLYAITNK